jgi:hypothetical protein
MLELIWSVVTLPFRLIGLLVAMVGRAVGLVIGFVLMVVGVALGAGAFFPLGIPLFIIGLILTLKSVS